MKKKARDQRVRIEILGLVQGVGFRPFVFRLAQKLKIRGTVCNTSKGVIIDAEGTPLHIDKFLLDLKSKKPHISYIQSFQYVYLDPVGHDQFKIKKSQRKQQTEVLISPDLATCPECLKEIFDPHNRRYLYPFTNCTLCGPRYSIIEKIPYDRCRTSMKNFIMCKACQQEFDDPSNRRFHAQPNACPQCGPQVALWDKKGKRMQGGTGAMKECLFQLKKGKIVAIKGLGGFHLMVDATNDMSVALLRERKQREEKPFALMFPSVQEIRKACKVSVKEKLILESAEAPIVLLEKRRDPLIAISSKVVFNNPYLGVMLPYTPLHHLLLHQMKGPLVATSGNLADEPICIDEQEAKKKLSGIVDFFLVHNRPIVKHVDDSIVRILSGRPLVLRRARGYAPLGVSIKKPVPPVLAYGADLKNTVALGIKKNIFLSQHIGDLETKEALGVMKKTVESLKCLYSSDIKKIACDIHPEYLSTQEAKRQSVPFFEVQHHHAHIAACMAENYLTKEVLGIAWDGTGFGLDRTTWGGEFLLANYKTAKRIATFSPFRLLGGDKASKEPRRTALAILYSVYGEKAEELKSNPCVQSFTEKERKIFYKMIENQINSPLASSVGRLFDAVSSLLGVAQQNHYEGQAAMMLEYLTKGKKVEAFYPFEVFCEQREEELVILWETMIRQIERERQEGKGQAYISKKFHNTLVEIAVSVAKKVKKKRIVLSGGCFQNKYLTEKMIQRLESEGFCVYTHQQVPPNDGCISLGQAMIAAAQ